MTGNATFYLRKPAYGKHEPDVPDFCLSLFYQHSSHAALSASGDAAVARVSWRGHAGIQFSNFLAANMVGQLALAIILLDGGLRTSTASFRISLKPAVVLASWGVLATVLVLGAFATYFFDVNWRLGFLMAAIVGSTDAAAVFSLLRSSGVRLNSRILSTLELESGANDPMAIFLVTATITMLNQPENAGSLSFIVMLLQQFG